MTYINRCRLNLSLTSGIISVKMPSVISKLRSGDIAKYTRLNGQIQALELRVIDEEGKQLGLMTKREALALAEERELDLVEISPDAKPPVAKIVDWGKFNYQRTKQQQKNHKAVKAGELKQVRFGLKIGEHDLAIKMGKVTKFLDDGHKVKLTIVYRGREQAHKEIGFNLAAKVIESFGDSIIVDQQPFLAGRQLNFVVRSSGKKKPSSKPEIVANPVISQPPQEKETTDAKA
jgi:translation initiation factor IF-3